MVMMVSNILLATKKMISLNFYVLFYLKWMDTQNILKMVAKICPSYLKMITKLKMIVKDDS